MVGPLDSDETLRVLGRFKNAVGMLDADNFVRRRMQDEQGLVQFADGTAQVVFLEVFQKLTLNPEFPAGHNYFGFAFRLNLRRAIGEKWAEVTGIARSSDCNYCRRLGDAACRGQDRRTSQAVPNE